MQINSNDLIINFYKPKGISSAEALNLLKKFCHIKKAGYAGTLDPLATGVLLVGINKGTKLLSQLTNLDKVYYVKVLFGIKTDTDDVLGNITKQSLIFPYSKFQIINAINSFLDCDYMQTPSKFSAVKINGIRAYKLARKNIDFELKPRKVNLYSYKIIKFKLPYLSLILHVSKGFYVRQFVSDLASKLHTYATVQEILRIKCGDYSIHESLTLKKLKYIYNESIK